MADVFLFPYAPADQRSPAQIAAQRSAVRAQIESWLDRIADDDRRREAQRQAMAILQDRRQGVGAIPFQLDDEFPVHPNRLIVREADAVAVLEELEGTYYAPQQVPVPDLAGVCVLQDVGAGTRSLRASGAVARTLTGGRAAPSYVALLGAIRKAEGGPEPSGPTGGRLWRRSQSKNGESGPLAVVIDNGVSAEQRADGWLTDLARTDNLDLLNVCPADDYLDLAAGHGTFATGIVQQVAPGARLEVRRALDTDGVGDEVEIGREIVRAAEGGAEIINLSLGFVTADDQPPLAIGAAIRTAVDRARERGTHLLLVCAAGNYGDRRPCWPAAFSGDPDLAPYVVSVAALRLDYGYQHEVVGAEWSTRGDWVTCSTLGQGVVSTYVVGRESPASDKEDPDTFLRNSWATWSGTSFTAPQVVGAIIRLMQEEGFPTARQALDTLLERAEDWKLQKNDAAVLDGFGVPLQILPV